MGWSCRADAHKTLDAWTKQCIASTGMQNVFLDKNGVDQIMFEIDQKEHEDGAITGEYGIIANDMYYPNGKFRIEGNGDITKGIGL